MSVPRSLSRLVRQRAQGRCEYCQMSEALSGLACEIDHIMPRAQDGPTQADNLCLACAACNGHKGARTHASDPESGHPTALFHPRLQRWGDHFAWSQDGVTVVGLTACGRATVAALHLNHPLAVAARSIWVSMGLHPPTTSN